MYLFNPSTIGTYNYTLPLITANGIKIKITRLDSDYDVILEVNSTSPNTIYFNVPNLTSVSIRQNTDIVFISHENEWYIVESSSRSISSFGSIFTGSLVSTNGDPYMSYSGNTTGELISTFSYVGSSTSPISKLLVAVEVINGPITLNFDIDRSDGTPVNSSTPILQNSTTYPITLIFDNFNQALLPTTISYLRLYSVRSGGGNNSRLYIYSFIIW
jgi:hypothetical protein